MSSSPAGGSTLGRRDLWNSLSDSSRRNTQQPANSPHNVATRLPGRSALSELDDDTYFEVLTSDILHLQQQLAALAHGTERAGRRLLSAGASYTERDLKAMAQAEEPSAAKLALHEILTNKQMLYERAVLHSTAKSASAPTKRIDDASDHIATSLSRLPYFYALVERLQALHEQASKPPIPTPPPASAAAVTPRPTPKPAAGSSAAGSADVLRAPAAAAQHSALVAELEALEREVAALAHARGAEREARKEGAQLRGQLSASEARSAAMRAEGEAAKAEVAQGAARQAHQAEHAAREAERLQRRLTEVEEEREGAVRERDEARAREAVSQAELAAALAAAMAARREEGRGEAAASAAAASAAAEVDRAAVVAAREAEEVERREVEAALRVSLAEAEAEVATQREAAARAREAAARLQQQLDGAQSGAQAGRQQEEAAAVLQERLVVETQARERAEREAEASARALQLWSQQQGLDDSFEAVLAEEMAAMREAFEAQLAELNARLATLRTEHRREVRELHASHDDQLRVAESRGRQAR